MTALGRWTLLLMIPMNVFIVGWVWIGRIAFGVVGWLLLILMVTAVPVLLIALILTTTFAFVQHGRPRSLTAFQTWSQLATWLALLVFGAFMPDFGDTEDSKRSLLTQAFGYSDDLFDLSFLIAAAAGLASVVGFIVLLVSLTAARRERPVTV